ncbi:MAG: response regulator transcription factor [Gaiellaceae bacterium]
MSAVAVALVSGQCSDGPAEPRAADRVRLSIAGEAEGGGEGAGALRVLLVEDDASMRLLCRVNLEIAGFTVEQAATGEEAVARAAAGTFDVVLLDVMLPDFSGIDVAERLRASPGWRGTPIVFASARGSETDIERGRVAGAIDYVVKPFDPVALPQRLRDDLEELGRTGADGVWRLRFGRGHAGA